MVDPKWRLRGAATRHFISCQDEIDANSSRKSSSSSASSSSLRKLELSSPQICLVLLSALLLVSITPALAAEDSNQESLSQDISAQKPDWSNPHILEGAKRSHFFALRGKKSVEGESSPQNNERFKRDSFNHLMRGKKEAFNHLMRGKKAQQAFDHLMRGKKAQSFNHLMRGKKAPAFDHLMRGKKAQSFDHLMRGKKAPAFDHLMRGKKAQSFDHLMRGKKAQSFNHLMRGKKADEEFERATRAKDFNRYLRADFNHLMRGKKSVDRPYPLAYEFVDETPEMEEEDDEAVKNYLDEQLTPEEFL